MNHHLPAMPHGQPPMPPSRRQQDFPYNAGPPNMRSPPYMGGYPPHLNGMNGMNGMNSMNGMTGMNGMNGMNGHMPPAYAPQQFPPWYPPYAQGQPHPRPFHPPYGPMMVSMYPPSHHVVAPSHLPPQSLPMQARTATPLQPTLSPSIAAPLQPEMQDHPVPPPPPPQHYPIASPSPQWEHKVIPGPKSAFAAPVSLMRHVWIICTQANYRYRSLGYRFLKSLSLLEFHCAAEGFAPCGPLWSFLKRMEHG